MYQFALVGCGRIGARHAEQIAKVGKLTAVCDVVPERADAFAREHGAKPYYSIDDLLKEEKNIDLVTVCTPNGLHAEHSIKALQARKHVLCEKPLCITGSAAWQMLNTAHFFRSRLFIVKQNRYNPPVQFVKQLLDEGKLGRIISFQVNCFWNRPASYYNGDWHGSMDLDGGLLYTQFSHFIDLIYWFFGELNTVHGLRQNNGLREHLHTEDFGAALLQMENGSAGTLHYTINSPGKNREGSLMIMGEKGGVKIGGEYLNEIEWLHTESGDEYVGTASANANDYGSYTGSMSNHHLVYQDLVKALDGKSTSLSPIMDAVKTIEMIEKIYQHTELTAG